MNAWLRRLRLSLESFLRRMHAAWLGVIAVVLLLSWLFVPWATYHWKRIQSEKQYYAAEDRWRHTERTASAAFWADHPGKNYPDRGPQRIAKMPKPVVDAWWADVLLDDGTVLTYDDLLSLHLGEAVPLPRPPSRHLVSLTQRAGAAAYADGTARIDARSGGAGRRPGLHGEEGLVSRRWSYTIPVWALPKPELGGLHALTDVVAVTKGESEVALILRRNGQVHTLGDPDIFGELGTQRVGDDGVPGFVTGDAVAIEAGIAHAVVLKRDGSVWTWGQYAPPVRRMITLPPEAVRPQVRKVLLPARATKIASGYRAAFALLEDGTVWGWGDPTCATLGVFEPNLPPEAFDEPGPIYDPAYPNFRQMLVKPRRIEGPSDIVDVQALGFMGVALRRDGRLWGWGRNGVIEIGISEYREPKTTGGCVVANITDAFITYSAPRLAHGIGDVKQVFMVPGATVLITRDDTLWYLGYGCKLCIIEREVHEFRAEKWGMVAAKGMWCGKVDEVTALRKAVDRMLFTRFPKVKDRTSWFGNKDVLEERELHQLRFRSVAKYAYLIGYDDATRQLRRDVGRATTIGNRIASSQSSRWFDALDLSLGLDTRDPAWEHIPWVFDRPERRKYEVTAILPPEVEKAFRSQHCAGIDQTMKDAMNEVAAVQRQTEELLKAERYPFSPPFIERGN
jgi:Regulator of chromosome condensation (RCC1) repeat